MSTKTIDDTLGDLRHVERLLAQSDFDALIAVSPDNVRYVGDVHISTQTSIRDRLALIVWPKGRDPVFVLCLVEEGYVRLNSWIRDIRSYKEFVVKPMDLLADVLAELGLADARVGCELDYLAALYADHLRARLPKLRLAPCTDLFLRARMFKTPREMAILRHGYRATEKALLATYATVRVGETEKSMANRLSDALMHTGADLVAYLHINTGANTGYPHMSPGDNPVQAGDIPLELPPDLPFDLVSGLRVVRPLRRSGALNRALTSPPSGVRSDQPVDADTARVGRTLDEGRSACPTGGGCRSDHAQTCRDWVANLEHEVRSPKTSWTYLHQTSTAVRGYTERTSDDLNAGACLRILHEPATSAPSTSAARWSEASKKCA